MAFFDDLLEQSYHLARRESRKPRQASLRRALSTCYYALFHLLIHEATLNWKRAEQRAALARLFDHGKMRSASERQAAECKRLIRTKYPGQHGFSHDAIERLREVTVTFVAAQHVRHLADYDSSKKWTRIEVVAHVESVQQAFASWKAIREESIAQDYLLSLLGNPRG